MFTPRAAIRSFHRTQVNVLSQLYGAVCDQQYLLTAKPTFARRLSDDEAPTLNMEVTQEKDAGLEQPDTWRDPYGAKVELANPSGEETPHNISMI